MNFKQCAADIRDLIDAVEQNEVSVESAKTTAVGIIGQYSDSRYEGFRRLIEQSRAEAKAAIRAGRP